ncbi:probable glycosyltransferase At5g03795 [Malania oleifera]|uniref:probable glycosyltransferase At5g03795 n=1 Tax=Malania oleifera TaxID=397392 RepID=UPI0025AEBF73|nr:probable glycosyltransferase At5g03795 [Malania oleifera]
MPRSSFALYHISASRLSHSFRDLFFIPTTLALITSFFLIFYISSTSNLFVHTERSHLSTISSLGSSRIFPLTKRPTQISPESFPLSPFDSSQSPVKANQSPPLASDGGEGPPNGNYVNNEVFHDRDIFLEGYKEMNRSFKIYIYPHQRDDPFANVFLPVDFEPGGNYASESYFKKVLTRSHFITKDPSKADLFFLPFSIARLRHDPRVGVRVIQEFIRDYILNISRDYPYWNRTAGADHFYVACHSIGRSAMEKADEVKFNVIQVVCSSSYFLSGYIAHKDASLPQIWPRGGDPSNLETSKRKKLAFFAGSMNSPVRQKLLREWSNDSEILTHFGRLKTPYADELLRSKFCLHVKGFEVNTARIADSLHYGCVPVIIANHYDLPFADILDWKAFSVVITTLDIPLLKKILRGIRSSDYLMLQRNVLKVRQHFQWHLSPVDYDAFYMVMYELWLRRSSIRIPLSSAV